MITMGEPMAMDSSIAGLEQSDHHPLTGRSQYSPPLQTQVSDSLASTQGGAGDLAASLIQHIEACVILGKKDKVSRLLYELHEFDVSTSTTTTTSSAVTSLSDNDPVTIGQLKAIP